MLAFLCGDGFSVAATEQISLGLNWQLRTWTCPHALPAWLYCHAGGHGGSASMEGGDGEQQAGDLAGLYSWPRGFLFLGTVFILAQA